MSRSRHRAVLLTVTTFVTLVSVLALFVVPASSLARRTTAVGVVTKAAESVSAAATAATAATIDDGATVGAASMPSPPYAVGVTHVTFVDATRGRSIAVTLRYPVRGTAGDTETTDEVADAGAYPLVVLAHGYDVSAATYAALEHQLAAAGFVVAAPDFPETSSAATDDPDEDDVVNQATDVSFVVTQLLTPATVPHVLAGAISSGPVGVVGHSDGGVTAAAVAYNSTVADPRVGAAVILSGAEARYGGTWFSTQSPPLLAVHGTDDAVNPLSSSEQLFADATGSKMLVTVDGGSHLGPFTTDATEPAVGALVADFLRAHLDTDFGAAQRLSGDASVPGELSLAGAA
jgi:alpha-beta hydrolase superfamily lysophospholipase